MTGSAAKSFDGLDFFVELFFFLAEFFAIFKQLALSRNTVKTIYFTTIYNNKHLVKHAFKIIFAWSSNKEAYISSASS